MSRLVKVSNFRGAAIDGLIYHLILIMKKRPDNMLHNGINDAASKTSRQILEDLS